MARRAGAIGHRRSEAVSGDGAVSDRDLRAELWRAARRPQGQELLRAGIRWHRHRHADTALHHCGLATLTHTPSPMGFLNGILTRPANEKPYLLLVVGHPAADAQVPAIGKKPLAEIATFV